MCKPVKIFCKDCDFYVPVRHLQYGVRIPDKCKTPSNIKDTHHGYYKRYALEPAQLNSNNDCYRFKIKVVEVSWWAKLLFGKTDKFGIEG